jgi:hypothetical protein
MQFGLKMNQFFKCKNYFNQPTNCFVQMLYKAGVGFVVFVFVEEDMGCSNALALGAGCPFVQAG